LRSRMAIGIIDKSIGMTIMPAKKIRYYPRMVAAICVSMMLANIGELAARGDLHAELGDANQLLAEEKYGQAYNEFLKYSEYNQLAQFSLGLFELYGWGRQVDRVAACNWFEPSAAEDVPMAQELLGDCYRHGIHKPASFDRAKHWYTRAVGNGLPQGNCKLGKIYLGGTLVEKDVRKSIRLCEKAAESGSLEAGLYLGGRFEQGDEDIERDMERALYWYQVAAAANSKEAQYQVARIRYTEGTDAEGYSLALQFAETAAARGYRPAYLLTAQMYVNAPLDSRTNLPTPENLAKGYMWAQAVLRDAENEEDEETAEEMLQKIRSVMPKEWEKDLDGEVDDHFEQLDK
jgi:TPR repeat protein